MSDSAGADSAGGLDAVLFSEAGTMSHITLPTKTKPQLATVKKLVQHTGIVDYLTIILQRDDAFQTYLTVYFNVDARQQGLHVNTALPPIIHRSTTKVAFFHGAVVVVKSVDDLNQDKEICNPPVTEDDIHRLRSFLIGVRG